MGLDSDAGFLGGIGFGATVKSAQAAEDAEDAAYEAAQEQRKAIREEQSMSAARAAQEKRRMIREERIKKARVLATSQASGTVGSSGETGAVSALSTALGANMAFNAGMLDSAKSISQFNWNASLFQSEANKLNLESKQWSQVADLSMQIAKAGA